MYTVHSLSIPFHYLQELPPFSRFLNNNILVISVVTLIYQLVHLVTGWLETFYSGVTQEKFVVYFTSLQKSSLHPLTNIKQEDYGSTDMHVGCLSRFT